MKARSTNCRAMTAWPENCATRLVSTGRPRIKERSTGGLLVRPECITQPMNVTTASNMHAVVRQEAQPHVLASPIANSKMAIDTPSISPFSQPILPPIRTVDSGTNIATKLPTTTGKIARV